MSRTTTATLGTRIAKALAAACTVVIIMVAGLVDLSRTAPGPLSAVHGTLDELLGMNDCAACHGGWFGDMASSCLECHEGVEADIDGMKGLHGTQPKGVEPKRCALCHGEHNGSGFQIAGPRSFAMAGIGSREDVDHSRFGATIEGGHLELDCVKCHAEADREVLQEGAPRFRGLQSECSSCHESEHPKGYPTDCSVCHGQEDFEHPAWPEHDLVFARLGAHEEASCESCHEQGTETSIVSQLRSVERAEEPRACSACHEAPHTAGFLAGVGEVLVTDLDGTCAACHNVERGAFATAASEMERALHASSGFALQAPHAEVACDSCHKGTEQSKHHAVRTADQCAACHEDPHGGQFANVDEAETDCLTCHARDAFEPTLFDGERHATLSFALEGAHGETECAGCHMASAGPAAASGVRSRKFRGTDTACTACHQDAHDAFFDGRPTDGECSACHGVDDFSTYDFGAFDHSVHCGFALEGAHGQSECGTCHVTSETADESGRTFGRFNGFREGYAAPAERPHEKSSDCALCHESPHGESFAEDPEASCASCHVSTSFRLAGEEFDHSSTGFELVGKHQGRACSDCHAGAATRGLGGASHRTARAATCAGCHDDPHGGQFAAEEGQLVPADCARCHEPARPFQEPHFNHNFDSVFRLEGRHSELSCSACHAREELESGEWMTRYKPLAKDCAACHGQQEDGRLRKDG